MTQIKIFLLTSEFFKVQTWHIPAESAATKHEAFCAIDIDRIPISEAGFFIKFW